MQNPQIIGLAIFRVMVAADLNIWQARALVQPAADAADSDGIAYDDATLAEVCLYMHDNAQPACAA